jgi:hypothetical protein
MTTARPRISKQTLTTPQAAAYAGIIFAILQITSLVLIRASVPATPTASLDWLETSSRMVSLAIMLTPFAGIAFLWYMGVIRDRTGHHEDQFFSTLFLGSGLLYLAMTFVASAMAGGILNVYALDPGSAGGDNIYVYSRSVIYDINNVYGVRMAGMHMFISGSIWIRTGLMPRWLTFVTFLLALALLLTIGFIPWATLIFPAWVGMISVYILIQNLRSKRKTIRDDALALDD